MIKYASRYTEQEVADEYTKCKYDADYFICNYIEVEAPGGNSKLKTYEPQKKFLKSAEQDKHIIVLKSRQTGISTITQAYLVWVITFYRNVVIGVVSRDSSESTSFCKTVISMIESLPEWLRPKFKKCAEQQFITVNGCKFYASQISPSNPGKLFRGKAITIAVIDEAAFADKIEEAFKGFGPTLVKAQKTARERNVPYGTFIISTPNKTTGIGKWYYDTWVQAESGNSIYKPVVVHWKDVEDFANDPEWYSTQCKLLRNDPVAISQELEMKFLAGSDSFFTPDTIEILNEINSKPKFKIPVLNSFINIWEEYVEGKYYLIGVDTATSRPGDYSALVVMDYETMEQVAEYWGCSRVDDYCEVLSKVTKLYPNCLVIAESNSVGNQVIEWLTRNSGLLDNRIYKEKIKSAIINNQTSKSKDIQRYRYGLATTAKTRPLMIDSLYTLVTENPQMIKSRSLALDLIGLSKKEGTGRVEASKGSHDDLSLALSFCCYVRQYDNPISVDTPNDLISQHSAKLLSEDLSDITDLNHGIGTEISKQQTMSNMFQTSFSTQDMTNLMNVMSQITKRLKHANSEDGF